jgi:hypothetical protein
MTLDARCEATGWWRLLHPIINVAMRMSDSKQLESLNTLLDKQHMESP